MYAGRELWWESRQRDREPTRLNFELIVRKSIKDTTIEYINHCTVAGIKEIREPDIDIRQRVIYTLIFLVSFISLIYVLKYTESQTFSNPLVVTRESSTYSIDMIDFPAVAICNVNRISRKSLEMYTKELYEYATASNPDISLNQTELYEYIKQYGKLIDFTFTEDMLVSPIIDEEFDKRGSHRIMNVMEQLAPSCDEMLLKCAWAGNIINCTEIFDVRRTVRGHCCVFNYVVGHNSAVRPNKTKIKKVLRQNERGVIHGLHVIMDPLIEDYAYPLRAVQGFDILLFEPTNYPDPTGGRVIHRFISPNEVSNLELESTKQLAAPEVRHYPRYTRRCLFHNEMPDLFGDMYSYSTCIVRCRLKTVQTLCKCAPYFLPSSEHSIFTCTLERLRCLNKYKEKLLYQYPYKAETLDGLEMEVEDALSCPECLPDCEFTHHNSKVFKLPITLARGGYEFGHKEHRTLFSVPNLTNKCVLNVFQSAGDGRLNRLDIISYWFEILSNVGGYAGILLGFSIISAMEVVYFLIFRFPRVFYNNYIKYS